MTQVLPSGPSKVASAPRLWALVPCAGTGSRAGTAFPKQFENVAGKPMVWYTLAAFRDVGRLAGLLLVVAKDDRWIAGLMLADATALDHVSVVYCGGATRASTVLNGLKALLAQGGAPHDWVLVHDAARCLVSAHQINALIDACWSDPIGGLLALPLPDTLKSEGDGRVVSTIERSGKWLAQTPQMFRLGPLHDALQQVGVAVTDEASAMEAMGLQPKLVQGSAQNFKVTYPEDFALAEAVLRSRSFAGAASTQTTRTSQTSQKDYDYP